MAMKGITAVEYQCLSLLRVILLLGALLGFQACGTRLLVTRLSGKVRTGQGSLMVRSWVDWNQTVWPCGPGHLLLVSSGWNTGQIQAC